MLGAQGEINKVHVYGSLGKFLLDEYQVIFFDYGVHWNRDGHLEICKTNITLDLWIASS